MEGGVVLRDALVFQHVEQSGLAGVVQPEENQLAIFVCETWTQAGERTSGSGSTELARTV